MKNNQTTLQAIEALDSIDQDPLMRATVIKKCVTDMTPFLHKLTAVQVAELQATLAQDHKTIPVPLARVWILDKMIRVLEKLLDAAVLDANRQGVSKTVLGRVLGMTSANIQYRFPKLSVNRRKKK